MSRLLSSLLLLTFLGTAAWSQVTTPAPLELSADSAQPLLIRKVAPLYPPLARQARIQGTVFLKIIISKEGDVRDAQLVSGHPMLAPAAIAAVKQWKYRPYTQDGDPVEIATSVRVDFRMADDPQPKMIVGDAAGPDAAPAVSIPDTDVPEAVMRGQRIDKFDPVYPQIAIEQGIQGTVVLKARVNLHGDVEGVSGVEGDPVLVAAAIEAVKHWKYKPYLSSDGYAMPVVTNVTFNFNLATGSVLEPAVAMPSLPKEAALASVPGPVRPQRVRVSAGVMQGLLRTKVDPEYPADAKAQHIQGTVRLRVNIDREGNVYRVELISGDALLEPAAINAVLEWKYRPFLLNGEAMEVESEVQVNFALAE